MNDNHVLNTLNRAFIRVYRSMGQYLHEADPTFDIGADTIRALWQREADDARRLGQYIADRQGNVETGVFSIDFCDLHFLNTSRLVRDWQSAQETLVQQLEDDRAVLGDCDDPGVALLDDIIQHERDALDQLGALVPVHAGV